ncbi:MAG: beta-ketoacyl-ACP reductase [delta proteobacterium MLS_D]|jgi:3-oxoacyl-[acyl-carrier protein] reductase|nr:MAG: beta-ketoacyl-ACP reductase [delta proteobacterium MLS_D]
MKEPGILDNRVALVTGASRGIGRAVAVRLAAMGAFVYINYLSNEEAARETLEAVKRVGGRGAPAPFDVAHTESVRHATTKILKEQSSLDILVNNAGMTMNALVLRTGEADWDSLMNTNLKGTFNCCRAVLRGMLRRRWGRIVNMVSVVAEGGNAGQACYGASKAGVLGFTRSLAKEVGSRNICVNAVAPGFIETDMTTELDGKNRRRILEQVPLGRMGNPGDVAGAVAFLVSPDAEYITGQVIRVNGGLYM